MSRQKFLFLLTLYFLTVQNVLANEARPYSGPFIGLNVGYGNSDLTLTATDVPRPSGGWSYPDFGGLNGITFDDQLNGALGGIDVGYNWNSEDWVYGVEASYALLDLNHSDWTKADDKRQPNLGGIVSGQDDVFNSNLKSLALLSLRLGRKIDKLLFYGRAGFAAGNYHLSVVDQNISKTNNNTGNNTGRGSDKKWLTGYSVGVGGEYLLNESWSAGLEYNYVRLDSSNINPGGTGCYNQGNTNLTRCSYLDGLERPVTYKMRPEIDLQLMAFHINYHF